MSSSLIENCRSRHPIASNPDTESIGKDSSDPKPNSSDNGIFREARNSRPAMKRQHLKEFRASGISDEIARLNFKSVDQQDAFTLLTYAVPQAELRINTGRLRTQWLRRYDLLEAGAWAVNGLDPDTHWEREMEWGRVKPDVPRRAWDSESKTFKDKVVKYESPAKTSNRVTYLKVDLAAWQRIAWRYGLPMPPVNIPIGPDGEALGFWEWVKDRPQIEIVLTEGEKKAAALLSRGIVAIALPGIYCGTVRNGSTWQLHPDLVHLASKQRSFYILFDHEPLADKKRHLEGAISRLGKAIEAESVTAMVATLPGPEKGIDDYLVARERGIAREQILEKRASIAFVGLWSRFPKLALARLQKRKKSGEAVLDLLARAMKLKDFNRLRLLPLALPQLTRTPDRTVDERYLSHLIPTNQRLVCLKSPKGTGKTEAISHYLSDHLKNFDGRRVLALTHRTQLGLALCNRFGIPYRDEMRSLAEGDTFGMGLCVDSLHPLSGARFIAEDWEGAIVVIDESEQFLWHALSSSTCRRDRILILRTLNEVLKNASQVLIADADLSDVSLNFFAAKTGCEPWLLTNDYQFDELGFDTTLYGGRSPVQLVAELMAAISRGDRVFIQTSSQKHKSKWATRTLERMLREKFPDRRIVRIDSESVGDKTHEAFCATARLNELLLQYDIVIASPSLETGVSIDLRGHFNSVWAIATGLQSPQSVAQAISRLREPVPRHVWLASRGSKIAGGETNWRDLCKAIETLSDRRKAGLVEFHDLETLKLSDIGLDRLYDYDLKGCNYRFEPLSAIAWAQIAVRVNAGAVCYRSAFAEILKREGHRVRDVEAARDSEALKAVEKQIGQTRDVNYAEHRSRVASPERYLPDDGHYKALANQIAMTEDERETLKHNALARRYGVEVTPELIEKDDRGYYSELLLDFFFGEGRGFLSDRALRRFASQSKDGAVFAPDFSRDRLVEQIKILDILGIEQLDNISSFQSQGDPIVSEICRKARSDVRSMRLYFGIEIGSKTTDVHIINALLRKRAKRVVRLRRERSKDGSKLLSIYSRPLCDFISGEDGKPILDANGEIIRLSDGREKIFDYWRSQLEENREKAVARAARSLGGERRDSSQIGFSSTIDSAADGE